MSQLNAIRSQDSDRQEKLRKNNIQRDYERAAKALSILEEKYNGINQEGKHEIALRDLISEQEKIKLKWEKRKLERESHRDPLTWVLNRRGLEKELEQFFSCWNTEGFKTTEERIFPSNMEESWFLGIDFDDFKTVNDTHGHEAWDRVLTETIKRIQGVVRKQDHVVRLWWDEFGVLIVWSTSENIDSIIQRIRDATSKEIKLDEWQMIQQGISIWKAQLNGKTFQQAKNEADEDMYEDKKWKQQRNRAREK